MDNRPIGIFDSGVGGLTVTKEIMALLPNEEICYVGDCKRAPYGSRDKETLKTFGAQIFSFLMSQNVKAIAVACNTIGTTCLDELVTVIDVPVVDIVLSGVLAAVEETERSVLILATKAATESGVHKRLILQKRPGLDVRQTACLSFAGIVEANAINSEEAYADAKKYITAEMLDGVDTALYGCTHYPIMADAIKSATGGVKLVDPAKKCARLMRQCLSDKGILSGNPNPSHKFYSSDTQKMNVVLKQFINETFASQYLDLEQCK